MRRLLLALALLAAVATPAAAQQVYDLDAYAFAIGWDPNAGTPDELRIYCDGALAFTITDLANPLATLREVLKAEGTYTCHATAANAAGESDPFGEMTVTAGQRPAVVEFVIDELQKLIDKLRAQ